MRRVLFVLLICAIAAAGQNVPDPALLAAIDKIPAIDNHTHVMKVTVPGARDTEFDALPCETLQPSDTQFFLRPENPAILAAWKALYGYPYNDQSPQHVRDLVGARQKVIEKEGDHFPDWVLDRINTRIMFANRVHMGRGLEAPRFVWVPYDDALLFPLNNSTMADTPDRQFFYGREEAILKQYLADAGAGTMPRTLSEYVEKIVRPTLQSQKQHGAVAIKFEVAYLRSLAFIPTSEAEAAAVYERAMNSSAAPSKTEYKTVQDYLFEKIAEEAGRLGLAVHLHTGIGCGGYYQVAGANPLNLERMLNEPSLRATNFVLLHGGFPFTDEMASMLTRPNVYTDTSLEPLMLSVTRAAQSIRSWLEYVPEKVLYGTDLYSGDDGAYGWDVIGWDAAHNTRYALALALTGMMRDGEITRAQALHMAALVLQGNAEKLYGFK
ncbi:MAG: amidohydrolase family protein [Terriglobales bacterium]